MLSGNQEALVQYIAELTKSIEGKRVPLAEDTFDASDDAEAVRKAEEWVSPLLALHFNEVVHMQIARRGGYGIFGKAYGEP
jgi:hypothetical protein